MRQAAGHNVLTHLLGQTLEELVEKVKAYRQAAAEAGRDPQAGTVTCMLHTFVGDDDAESAHRAGADEGLPAQLDVAGDGLRLVVPGLRSARQAGLEARGRVDLSTLTEDETDAILEFAFERYYETSGLFGTPEACEAMLERCKRADIDEIACLIDFGVDTGVVLESLEALDRVRRKVNERPPGARVEASAPVPDLDQSFAARSSVTA
ncbi:MAG: LLM class flavin-dependent oxidoreductase [Myxococcota bacterium]